MKAKVISMFNHKGGVSKTTTAFNVAWMLTKMNKKVMLVDGDPQCNLTGLFLGDYFDDYYENETTKLNNIKDAVAPAFKGKPMPIRDIDCCQAENNSSLYLIPGHMDLSEYDPALSLALNSNNAISTLQNLPGAFYQLIKLCADKYDIDYVLIDMNPGLSAINQTFFMSSDGFIIPTNPDPFSIMALKTLKTILPRWKKWAIQSKQLFDEASYPLPEAEMAFIGIVIQRFNLRNKKAAKPYQGKIDDIKNYVKNDLALEFSKHNMLLDISPAIEKSLMKDDYCLAEISDFGALLQKSHENLIPVFELSDEQLGVTGTVLEGMNQSKERFKVIFTSIADIITEII